MQQPHMTGVKGIYKHGGSRDWILGINTDLWKAVSEPLALNMPITWTKQS
jgi:hypothetical protein